MAEERGAVAARKGLRFVTVENFVLLGYLKILASPWANIIL